MVLAIPAAHKGVQTIFPGRRKTAVLSESKEEHMGGCGERKRKEITI